MLTLEETEGKICEISLYYLHNSSCKSRITAKGKRGENMASISKSKSSTLKD